MKQINNIVIILIIVNLFLGQFVYAVNYGEEQILAHAYNHNKLKTGEYLNVHLFPHSHTDVGWLKSVEDYLLGYRTNDIYMTGNATQTLNSITAKLLEDEKYKFVWAEQAFFSRWYMGQNQNTKDAIKYLIQNKQFSLVGGGWVVNDEGCTNYEDIIDQLTVGHQFLDTYLDFKPTMGWQQDPFGHSLTQAWIMSQMGFDGIMMSRMDYQEELMFIERNRMQFLWDLPHDRLLFTHILFYRYVAPEDFQYDQIHQQNDFFHFRQGEPIRHPSKMKSEDFVYWLRNVSYCYNTDEFTYSLGNDYTFQDADYSFTQYDEYIKNSEKNYNNLKTKLDYIRADDYLKILHNKKNTFPKLKKGDDFFPYRDTLSGYWTGYFTTRPYLKKLTMDGGRLLQKVRNFVNFQFLDKQNSQDIFWKFNMVEKNITMDSHAKSFEYIQKNLLQFEQEIGVMQHHDAVTGTCKSYVAVDYENRVYNSRNKFMKIFQQIVSKKSYENLEQNDLDFVWCEENLHKNQKCQLGDEQDQYLLNIFNFQSKNIKKVTEIQGFQNLKEYQIYDLKNEKVIQGELLCDKNCTLYFETDLQFQDNYYILRKGENSIKNLEKISDQKVANLTSQNQTLEFYRDHHFNFRYQNENKNYYFYISYKYYNKDHRRGANGEKTGAYLFVVHQKDQNPYLYGKFSEFSIYQGELVSCFKLTIKPEDNNNSGEYAQVCMKKHENFISLNTFLESQSEAIEIVLDLQIKGIKSQGRFQTDSNGLFRLDRVTFKSEKKYYKTENDDQDYVAGNFYPMNKFATISSLDKQARFTVINDRNQGVTSMKSGNIQIMIHRQAIYDDGRGLGESLQDSNEYLFSHYLLFDREPNAERQIMTNIDLKEEIFMVEKNIQKIQDIKIKKVENEKTNFLLNLFKKQTNLKFYLKYLKNNEFLLRVQNFQDLGLIKLNLNQVFESYKEHIKIVGEYNIQGTREIQEVSNNNLKFYDEKDTKQRHPSSGSYKQANLNNIGLRALDIRTFKIQLINQEFEEHQQDIGFKIWDRDTEKFQKFCQPECYQQGVCVWNKCKCIRNYGAECENKCIENCLKCSDDKSCQTCDFGYKMFEGKCVQEKQINNDSMKCENAHYWEKTYGKCQQCDQNCQECEIKSNQCIKCNQNYKLDNGVCKMQCQNGEFYYNNECNQCSEVSNIIPNCVQCDQYQGCSQCQGDNMALILKDGFYICDISYYTKPQTYKLRSISQNLNSLWEYIAGLYVIIIVVIVYYLITGQSRKGRQEEMSSKRKKKGNSYDNINEQRYDNNSDDDDLQYDEEQREYQNNQRESDMKTYNIDDL